MQPITFSTQVAIVGDLVLLPVPPIEDFQRRFARITATVNGVSFATLAGSADGLSNHMVIPAAIAHSLALAHGQVVTVEMRVLTRELPPQRVLTLLHAALEAEGLSIDVLPAYERRQLLTAVNESHSPEVQRHRVAAVVAACRTAVPRRGSI